MIIYIINLTVSLQSIFFFLFFLSLSLSLFLCVYYREQVTSRLSKEKKKRNDSQVGVDDDVMNTICRR